MRRIFTHIFLLSSFSLSAQDGKIDSTFGTDGRVSTTVFSDPVLAGQQQIVVLPTGKILQSFSILGNFGIARYNNDDAATLDASFGRLGTGIDTVDFGAGTDVAASMAVQGDGKIVVAGYSNNLFALVRYNANGTLDATFDGDGRVTTTFGTTSAGANAVTIAPDGKIVVAGYSFNGTTNSVAIARYNTNGSLDATFDGDGRVTTSFNAINDQAFAAVVQGDGKVVIAGFSQTAGGSAFAVGRYNTNGALDATFDGDGRLTTAFGSDAGAYAIALQSDGKIVVGGYGTGAANTDYALARYNVSGTLDNTFDTDGRVVTAVGTGSDIIYSVGVQNDGRIVAAGTSVNTENDFSIARYTTAGAPDVAFDVDGKNIIDFGGSEDYGYSFGAQGLNLIVGGTAGTSLALTRLTNSAFILPVSLHTFSATKQTGAVVLNWQTLNEQSLASFEVQRSSDGRNFSTVGIAAAGGNSASLRNYSLADVKPLSGVNHYRLKMIDVDGKFAFSKTIIVRFEADAVTLLAFPNPVRTVVNLQFTAPAGKVRILVSDAIGRTVTAFEIASTGAATYTSLDMSSYKKGIYYININGRSFKVVKD